MLKRYLRQFNQSPDGLYHAITYAYANDGLGMPKFALFGDSVNPIETSIAAATLFTPLSYVSIVTGTAQIQSIALPWPGFAGDIVLIYTDASPGATLTGGTAGMAIQLATTAVRYKALTMTYSQLNGIWYPSY
jgi:hypothetical protein